MVIGKAWRFMSKITDNKREHSLLDGALKYIISHAIEYGYRAILPTLERKNRDGWNWRVAHQIRMLVNDYCDKQGFSRGLKKRYAKSLAIVLVLMDEDNHYQTHGIQILKEVTELLKKEGVL